MASGRTCVALACCWLVALILADGVGARPSPKQHQRTGHHDDLGVTKDNAPRAKRQMLLGTPSLPLMQDVRAISGPRRKRPFCNAFTGCGRKRSSSELTFGGGIHDNEDGLGDGGGGLGALVELNSEPAVAELSRQILSEAKLWEAIQEARREMMTGDGAMQQQERVERRRRQTTEQRQGGVDEEEGNEEGEAGGGGMRRRRNAISPKERRALQPSSPSSSSDGSPPPIVV